MYIICNISYSRQQIVVAIQHETIAYMVWSNTQPKGMN